MSTKKVTSKPLTSLIAHSTRYGCVGGLINNEPFFCGGEYDTGNKFNDGFVVGQPNKKLQMQEKRFGAAGVGKIYSIYAFDTKLQVRFLASKEII